MQKSGLAWEGLIKEVRSLPREHGGVRKEKRIHEKGLGG